MDKRFWISLPAPPALPLSHFGTPVAVILKIVIGKAFSGWDPVPFWDSWRTVRQVTVQRMPAMVAFGTYLGYDDRNRHCEGMGIPFFRTFASQEDQ
jgi:hypothetical protein